MKTLLVYKLLFWIKMAFLALFLGLLARVFFGKRNFNFLDFSNQDLKLNKEEV